MPSRLEQIAAVDFQRGTPEIYETITRRIGGRDDETERVSACVEFDDESGGLFDDIKGQRVEFVGVIEIAATQKNAIGDTWVIDGKTYWQMGEATAKDGATQTIKIGRTKGLRGRDARVSGK